VLGLPARHRPTDDDRISAIDIAVSLEVTISVTSPTGWPHFPRNNTFPGEVLLDLAADAIEVAGATRQSPIEFEGIRDRYLPEAVAHTKAQHHKSKYALRAAAMLHGGVDPGLRRGAVVAKRRLVVLVAGGARRLRACRRRPHR
jgi:hypothetical protein